MIAARNIWHLACLFTLLTATCDLAIGQDVGIPRSGSTAEANAAASVGNDPTVPTLEELKASGARRSNYRERDRRPDESGSASSRLAAYRNDIEPLLTRSCLRCHGPDEQNGDVRVDTLEPDLLHGSNVEEWLDILAVLSNGEMPPEGETELAPDDRGAVIEWLASELRAASRVRRDDHGHTSFRRMTRYEYDYALQDLLGLPHDFAEDLPPDPVSEDGFRNSSELLQMSAIQFGTYHESGRKALMRATVRGERPAPLYWSVSMESASAMDWRRQDAKLEQIKEKHKGDAEKLKRELDRQRKRFLVRPNAAHFENRSNGKIARASWSYPGGKYAWKPTESRPEVPRDSDHFAIIPPGKKLIFELGDRVPEEGMLRVRVRASRLSTEDNRIPSLQLEFGWKASNDSQASVRISDHDLTIDAPLDEPRFYHWDIPLSGIYPRNSVRKVSKMGDLPSPSEYVKFVNSSVAHGDIQIDHVEITAPVYESWPPTSHTRIFFDSANQANESAYAREVLASFMSRAWRRDATASEIDQKLDLFAKIRPSCESFQDAIVEVLAAVLTSPKFLYLVRSHASENAGDDSTGRRLSDFELATRLSMFLWCSTPGEELRELAAQGRLHHPDVLTSQVQRMLADPRSRRFSEHFVRQWLGMQLLDFFKVDKRTYPRFEPSLKEAMQEEPVAFFHEILRYDHSVLEFIHSDFTMVNERLARHYGLDQVYGNHFRRVGLGPEHRRGGLLTQAGLLAMNSDGKDSHPLKRGIWVLESLLNDPPPPPPPAVPEIDLADPEIAKLTLKQRIENHRDQPACMSCHARIDPWGIAFENFDAIGKWRTQIQGKPVDASSLLFNRQKLAGMDGLKRFLLEFRQDQFARALVYKMTTFALGRPLTFSDRKGIDQITGDLRKQGDGLATMVTLIATSELFQSK